MMSAPPTDASPADATAPETTAPDAPAPDADGGQGVVALVRRSLGAGTADGTRGAVGQTLALLAIPMALEMLLEGVFAVVDIVFVARLGKEAVASVGLTEAMLTLVYAASIGLASATTAMVSRRVGEGDVEGARLAAGQAMLLGAILALAVGIAGTLLADDLLSLIGADEAVVAIGSRYTAIILGGSLTVIYLFVINGIFRGAGDAGLAMRALWISNVINIVLDPLLIFGLGPFPQLGVTGAALATVIGRSAGVGYQCWHLFVGRQALHLRAASLRPRPRLMLRLLRIAAGAILQFLFATSAWIGLMRIVAGFGSGAVAGYTIAIRLVDFTFLPMWGLGNATATMVGQNLGAKAPARAERAVWLAARTVLVVMGGLGVAFVVSAPALLGLLIDDTDAIRYGANALRFFGIGLGTFSVGMILIQAFNGAGDTDTPMVVNFVVFWVLQLPLAWWLAHGAGLGPNGVFLAVLLSEALLAGVFLVLFRRGRWQQRMV